MRILIMGEKSQVICKAFRERGHEAYSCDLQDCTGGRPDIHIKSDMFEAFYSKPAYWWDMVIAHPVCTYMCNSGALRLYKDGKKKNGIDTVRWSLMEKSAYQFKELLLLPVHKLCIENPVMHGHAKKIIGVSQTQSIQPYEFGHAESKRTCLWLMGLPKLKPTNVLKKPECGYWDNQCKTGSGQNILGKGRGETRSITYTGIAKAMALQWG